MRPSPLLELLHLTQVARDHHDAERHRATDEKLRAQLQAYAEECGALEKMLATLAGVSLEDGERNAPRDGASLSDLRAAETAIIDACECLVAGDELTTYQASVVRRLRSLSAERRGWLRRYDGTRGQNRRSCA
jgi:hypothetical protein